MKAAVQIHLLENPIQHYDWGSKDGISKLLGVPNPDHERQAEIWMGAHPSAPSLVQISANQTERLDTLIAADPRYWLGQSTEPKLPFLFKVISAATPLSLQVHPDLSTAQEGFEFEERLGIRKDASVRNYKDANHKPELILALTHFKAMIGFRSPEQVVALLSQLNIDAFKPWIRRLTTAGAPVIRQFYTWMLMLQTHVAGELVAEVVANIDNCDPLIADTVKLFQRHYQGDPCVLAPLIMVLHELKPGEAVYLGAGLPHSYIEGTALEIMANSDNVIRGGLTTKHVDHQELIYVTDFAPHAFRVLTGDATQIAGERAYPVPTDEFNLSLLSVCEQPMTIASSGLEILLCLEGEAQVMSDDVRGITLTQGQSCVIPAALSGYNLTGKANIARATGK